ncbi:metallophosphoesterase [Sphingobacterium sp. HMA12]|uniref:metallophosphoesterase family protein n=1 Tax=Sphingobacterium sp. HMA12 TaxID=2050894 RepID=UPI000CE9DD6D|nr:metallophosphoesterase [Sphingobacterium sp. HMA12]
MKSKLLFIFLTPYPAFVLKILLVLLVCIVTLNGCNTNRMNQQTKYRQSFSLDGNAIDIHVAGVTDTINIIFLSDTHLAMQDDREKPYEHYSKRMSQAYTSTRHFQTGEETSPQQSFAETVEIAKEKNVDLLVLAGDIVSYPSERVIAWVDSILVDSKLKYVYTTGNHDWHYEGMQGSTKELRQAWINRRLLSLYQGNNPLYYAVDIKGIRVVIIDNSTYEISPEQLTFFNQQVAAGVPFILVMHIPLYVPGRPVNYGCAHPEWNKAHDKLYELERRAAWPEKGHTQTTMAFRQKVLNASNLLGVFTGHIHQQTLDVIGNLPLFVAKENASGNYYHIKIISNR